MYRHIWLGEPYDEVADSIIPVEWFDASIDAHIKLGFKGEGARIATHDPSDLGPDPKGYSLRHGSIFEDIREERVGDVNEGLDWALERAANDNADWFVWDCDGLGAPLKRDVDRELSGKKMEYFMFKGSEGVEDPEQPFVSVDSDKKKSKKDRKTNKESLKNKRAQYSHRLMMRFYYTWRAVVKGEYMDPDELISLSSSIENIDEVRAQVCRVPRKRNNNGKFQVMTKLEMSKKPYELPSPNMYDCMMMSTFQPKAAVISEELEFSGWG
jgi:phage terminase large subunit